MSEVLAIYLAAGVFSGLVSGLFGVGGAFALAPALIITLTLQGVGDEHVMHLTIATSLAVQVVTAFLTSYLRYRSGDLRLAMLGRIAPWVALGAIVGALIGDSLPGWVLKAVFISFVAFTILRGLITRGRAPGGAGGDLADVRGPGLWFFGTLSGVSGALLGPGPAIVLAPFLRRLRFSMPIVAATSAALAGLVGLSAAGGYIYAGFDETGLPAWTAGYLYLPAFASLAAGALVGSPLGIRFSHRVSDTTQMRLFLLYLSAVLAVMLLHTFAPGLL